MSFRPEKWSTLIAWIVAIMAALILSGCSSPGGAQYEDISDETNAEESISDDDEEEDVPIPAKEEQWHKVREFSGTGTGDTGSFEIKTDRYWRVTVTPADKSGPFKASLYLAGEDTATADHHGEITGSGDGPVALTFTETGKFFIRMESSSGSWKMLVEEIEFVYAE